jgi:hypothetical protein
MTSTIFNKEEFTLKELCETIKKIKYISDYNNYIEISNINIIADCYIKFSSGDNSYIKILDYTRYNKGYLLKNKTNNKNIYFREILQILDMEFTKLVIRIKTESKKYDIAISWKEFEEKIGIKKDDIEKLFLDDKSI